MTQTQPSKFDVFDKTRANYVPLSPLSFLPRTALMFGDRTATVYGERSYTWSEFYDRVKQVASALQKRGVGKGDTVSVIAANTPEMVELHFAVPMIGAVLNTINRLLDADTLAYIFDHAETKVLITDATLNPAIAQAVKATGNQSMLIVDIKDAQSGQAPSDIGSLAYEDLVTEGDADLDWSLPDDEWDALALNYTSGSTGRPKGVVYHHRGAYLMAQGTITDWSLPKHPTYLYVVPLFHCNGWCHGWAMAALAGTIICTRAITPQMIYEAIDQHGVTHFGGAPIVLSMILNADESVRKPFEHNIQVMTAGAPPPAAVLEGIERLGFNVTQVYGLTETYGHIIMCSWNSDWDGMAFSERATIKARQGAGMVIAEGMRVVSLETGEDVPADGETMGEVLLRGNTVMKGYLKNEQATKEAFADGWFRSGDLAVMHPRGYMEVKDRLKDVIISGGENISSVEVEGVVARHPAVALCAVVAKQDDKWGEVPCAFVELKDGASATEQEIKDFTRQHMAGFKCPKQVIFGELPKTATGKIQKFELRKQIA